MKKLIIPALAMFILVSSAHAQSVTTKTKKEQPVVAMHHKAAPIQKTTVQENKTVVKDKTMPAANKPTQMKQKQETKSTVITQKPAVNNSTAVTTKTKTTHPKTHRRMHKHITSHKAS